MTTIRQAAVIGAGTMGSQIAAVIANANTKVLLLDIVPKGANDRDELAKRAIEKLKKGTSLFSEEKAENIQPGNMEDDLDRLQETDWVIECVPEDERIKHETYRKVGAHTGSGTLVSSNTSTIPLTKLKKGLDSDLQKRLCITHFFNPPTKMPLLELVADQDNDPQVVARFREFADRSLGKNVIMAKDTPGFIGNRIGMFWLLVAMEEARKEGIAIETADAVMNGAFGFPKTGVFALADLIGLKLIPDIARSMCDFLPDSDAFCQLEGGLKLVEERIRAGDTGKSKPGFYKKDGDNKQALDLESGEYRPAENVDAGIGHWHEFLAQEKPESRFARNVLVRLLEYSARVAPDIADSILDVDAAMRDGYGWKHGPFGMIDRLGASWLAERIVKDGGHPPMLLKAAEQKGFHPQITEYLGFSGRYRQREISPDTWRLEERTARSTALLEGETARLWDIGDGITCFELTARMGVMNEEALDLLVKAVEKSEAGFRGMILGHDGKHFSAGLDLHIIAGSAGKKDWKRVEAIIRQGQETMLRVKTARVPVVPALCGYVLGGACELTLHCVAAQAHSSTRIGLVETGIGVIPAWGGTKEHLVKAAQASAEDADKVAEELAKAFGQIAGAKKSRNAEEAMTMELLTDISHITMNRERLLPDAKRLCLELAGKYQPRGEAVIEAPVEILYERLEEEVAACLRRERPDVTPHRRRTLESLAEVLSGYRALKKTGLQGYTPPRAGWERLSSRQVLDSTREAFMALVQSEEALEKIRGIVK